MELASTSDDVEKEIIMYHTGSVSLLEISDDMRNTVSNALRDDNQPALALKVCQGTTPVLQVATLHLSCGGRGDTYTSWKLGGNNETIVECDGTVLLVSNILAVSSHDDSLYYLADCAVLQSVLSEDALFQEVVRSPLCGIFSAKNLDKPFIYDKIGTDSYVIVNRMP